MPSAGQRPHAADAQQQLLADADAIVAAVEPRGQLAILRAVASTSESSRSSVLRPTASFQTRATIVPVRVSIETVTGRRRPMRQLQRQQPAVDVEVVFVLPAVRVEPLPEIALVVEQADADERDAQV